MAARNKSFGFKHAGHVKISDFVRGGETGIRTLDPLARKPALQAGALGRYAISPNRPNYTLNIEFCQDISHI
jgi:hypothetical protein